MNKYIAIAIAILKAEIEWCKKNPMEGVVTPDYRDGFIKALESAVYLLGEVEPLAAAMTMDLDPTGSNE